MFIWKPKIANFSSSSVDKAGVLYPYGTVRPDLLSWWVFGDTLVFKLVGGALFFVPTDKASQPKTMEIEKAKTVAFTGNRELTTPKGLDLNLKNVIRTELAIILEACYQDGKTCYLSGMAMGWDMLCTEEVLNLKLKHPDVELIAVVPFEGQEAKYSLQEKNRYYKLLEKADKQIIISPDGYSNAAYHKRNDYLVANASRIIAYHNGKPRSCTGSTIRKAQQVGLQLLNLYDELTDYFNTSHPVKRFLQSHNYVDSFKYGKNGILFPDENNQLHPINFAQIESAELNRGWIIFTLSNGIKYSASLLTNEVRIRI